jgi:hypothetical protein
MYIVSLFKRFPVSLEQKWRKLDKVKASLAVAVDALQQFKDIRTCDWGLFLLNINFEQDDALHRHTLAIDGAAWQSKIACDELNVSPLGLGGILRTNELLPIEVGCLR